MIRQGDMIMFGDFVCQTIVFDCWHRNPILDDLDHMALLKVTMRQCQTSKNYQEN